MSLGREGGGGGGGGKGGGGREGVTHIPKND